MELHPLAAKFASVADAYELGRPEYAPAVVGALGAELGLRPGAPVLDLAAGTGKLTRALVRGGFEVIAVEPQAELRDKLAVRVGAERVRDGVAEAIPLDDGSVDAVTVADGFHWFDRTAALSEIGRVLTPGGGLAILTSIPDWSTASWAHELGSKMGEMRPAHPYFDGPPWSETVRETAGWTEPREVRVTAPQPTSAERLVAYVASMSWVAAMPDDERTAWLDQVAALVDAGETPSEMNVQVIVGLARLEG